MIIFENFDKYLNMNKWNRELLDKYCREFGVGIIGLMQKNEERRALQLNGFPLFIDTGASVRDYRINPLSPVLRLTRAGEIHYGRLPGEDWVIFRSNHTSYQPLGQAFRYYDYESYLNKNGQDNISSKKLLATTVIQV